MLSGKETVKFLAIFEQTPYMRSLRFVSFVTFCKARLLSRLTLSLNICLFAEHFLNLWSLIEYERTV
jgi:hypothetical protein